MKIANTNLPHGLVLAPMAGVTDRTISGVIYVICFLLSTAFSIEGGNYEMAGAVTDNVLIALTLPFMCMGCNRIIKLWGRNSNGFYSKPPKIPFIAIILLFMISPSVAAAILSIIGIAASLRPITSTILRKFLRTDGTDKE